MSIKESEFLFWLSAKDAAEVYGITENALRKREARDSVPSHRDKNNNVTFGVPAELVTKFLESECHGALPVKFGKKYSYYKEKDLYVFPLPKKEDPWIVRGFYIREMMRFYANNSKVTIKDVSLKFGIEPKTFRAIKDALGLTKNSSGWTDEELEEESTSALVASALRVKERKALIELERQRLAEMQSTAEFYDSVEALLLGRLSSYDWPEPTVYDVKKERKKYACFFGVTDLHLGVKPHREITTLKEQVSALKDAAAKLASRVFSFWGVPEVVYLMVGSDLMHIDSLTYATKKGTPQGAQTIGTYEEHFDAAVEVCHFVVDLFRQYTDCELYWIPGNHDHSSSYGVAATVKARFHTVNDVRVDLDKGLRKTTVFGETPIMFLHGHGARSESYSALMVHTLSQRGQLDGADISKGVVFRGHYHRAKAHFSDEAGLEIITLSGPPEPDAWHHEKGYELSKRKLQAYRVDNEGASGMVSVNVDWF